jgi:hypothetical protein
VLKIHGPTKADDLLARTGLALQGEAVRRRSGGDPDDADCAHYLDAVKVVLGDAAFLFTRANFRLVQCPRLQDQ